MPVRPVCIFELPLHGCISKWRPDSIAMKKGLEQGANTIANCQKYRTLNPCSNQCKDGLNRNTDRDDKLNV